MLDTGIPSFALLQKHTCHLPDVFGTPLFKVQICPIVDSGLPSDVGERATLVAGSNPAWFMRSTILSSSSSMRAFISFMRPMMDSPILVNFVFFKKKKVLRPQWWGTTIETWEWWEGWSTYHLVHHILHQERQFLWVSVTSAFGGIRSHCCRCWNWIKVDATLIKKFDSL